MTLFPLDIPLQVYTREDATRLLSSIYQHWNFLSAPHGSTNAFTALICRSPWPLQACAKPQAGVTPLRRSPLVKISMIVDLTLFFVCGPLPPPEPSRAVSSPGRAFASAAAAGAADPLARCRTRSREASTSKSATSIFAIYGAFQPSQRFDATPRHRTGILS